MASPGSRRPTTGVGRSTVYLLLGDEDVRAEQALGRLLDDLLPPGERALNLEVVDAGEMPVQEIITRCETLPFFGARRVVVVRRGEAFRAHDQDALAAYLDRGPSPSTALILIAESLDRRRRLYSVLQRVGRIVPCGRLRPEDLPGWIRGRVAEEGKEITRDAVEALVGLVGGGLRELGLEIAKLVAYVGARPAITAGDVREAASHVAEATVFELMDAVGHRQADKALEVLQTVIALGEPPVRILYMLEDQLRMLLRTGALLERRRPPARISQDEIREVLGNRAWLFDRYRGQVAAFGRMDVAKILGLLVETDALIKTGATPPRLAIETLIVRLCLQ
jgi:DNA polymerase III subunit delta